MSNTTLKPCPFCGGSADHWVDEWGDGLHVIECIDCGCAKHSNVSRGRAEQIWNTRATGWIDIKERKPEFGEHCLFVIETSIQWLVCGFVDEGDGETRFEDCSICDQYTDHIGYDADCISYWMPRPTLPAEESAA